MPFDNYRIMPVMVWLTTNSDFGYVYSSLFDENNPLTNHMLVSAGFGLDLILYNRYVFQFQYSFNHRMENGFYFHISTDF